MRCRLAALVTAAVAVTALCFASSSSAWVVAGKRWPGPTVSVWNETAYKGPVRQAMQAWNAAGAAIQLTTAPTRETADVVLSYAALREQGRAEIGYTRGGARVWLGYGLSRVDAAAIAAHELGHVLGLGHETALCALMNPIIDSGAGADCKVGNCATVWRCLIQPDDARGLRLLYGRASGT